jgi:hypothetical protein
VLLPCNFDETENLKPLVTGKYAKPRWFKNTKPTAIQVYTQQQSMGNDHNTVRLFKGMWCKDGVCWEEGTYVQLIHQIYHF